MALFPCRFRIPITGNCASRHRNASLVYASVYKRDIGIEPHVCGGELGLIGRPSVRQIKLSNCSMLRAAPASMSPSQRTALAQYAGRLHRLHDAKREVIIYDYVDMSVPVLARMAAKRRVGYQTIGYRILGTGDLFSDQSVASEASGEAPATFSV